MSGYVSARFDLPRRDAERMLVVASSYRCGSTYLSSLLWADGRFGAPFEYFNFEKHMLLMMARFGEDNPDKFFVELIKRRTSNNGVFSVKAHFHHFEAMLSKSTEWERAHANAFYVYVNRGDKIAQAVSMAKALQSNAWVSFETARQVPLFYSSELIDECLREVMRQTTGWWKWFEKNKISPYIVNYEEFTVDPLGAIDQLALWFRVDGDKRDPIALPMTETQTDAVNREWIERYVADNRSRKS